MTAVNLLSTSSRARRLPRRRRPSSRTGGQSSPTSPSIDKSDGPFFLGATPYYCDLGVFHQLDNCRSVELEALAAYPKVVAFMARSRPFRRSRSGGRTAQVRGHWVGADVVAADCGLAREEVNVIVQEKELEKKENFVKCS